MTIRTVI